MSCYLQIREQRAAELEQAISESRKLLEQTRDSDSSESGSDNEEWAGFEDPQPVDYEEEYIDEDKYTTVTVEEMGLSRDALHGLEENDNRSSGDEDGAPKEKDSDKKDETKVKADRKQNSLKKKKKKFRYESKEERKVTQRKQKSSSRKKASARRER